MRQSRPIGLLISFIIFYHLPNFTYLEAEKIIIKENTIESIYISTRKTVNIRNLMNDQFFYTI